MSHSTRSGSLAETLGPYLGPPTSASSMGSVWASSSPRAPSSGSGGKLVGCARQDRRDLPTTAVLAVGADVIPWEGGNGPAGDDWAAGERDVTPLVTALPGSVSVLAASSLSLPSSNESVESADDSELSSVLLASSSCWSVKARPACPREPEARRHGSPAEARGPLPRSPTPLPPAAACLLLSAHSPPADLASAGLSPRINAISASLIALAPSTGGAARAPFPPVALPVALSM
mmetsp:Transcript_24332/g.74306  ORF Transcript_24332/g.74306 Transcript_24332/m.74306 type:complete len:233 (-) Transcript_24332:1308-2006(-)|eukprot:scaffold82496_cov29-Tisochrysis_lutea.AAC.11